MIAPASRDPSALPPTLSWIGPGLTAFAGPAGSGREGGIALVRRRRDLAAVFGGGGDAGFLDSLGAYFALGGGPCAVLNLPPLPSVPPERRGMALVGEDGGPGYRTGICSLLDHEDIGTIAVPGLLDSDLRRRLLASLEKEERRFVLLDPLPGGEEDGLPPSDHAAVCPGPLESCAAGRLGPGMASTETSGSISPSARLAAELEAKDFREDRPDLFLRGLAAPDHPTLGSRFPSIESWRAWEGLRRSIDLGTRWIVFEANNGLLWRRVEREIGAFLDRLRRLGFLDGAAPEEAFRVRCEPPRLREQAAEGLLLLRVEVRMRGARRLGELSFSSPGGIAGSGGTGMKNLQPSKETT